MLDYVTTKGRSKSCYTKPPRKYTIKKFEKHKLYWGTSDTNCGGTAHLLVVDILWLSEEKSILKKKWKYEDLLTKKWLLPYWNSLFGQWYFAFQNWTAILYSDRKKFHIYHRIYKWISISLFHGKINIFITRIAGF